MTVAKAVLYIRMTPHLKTRCNLKPYQSGNIQKNIKKSRIQFTVFEEANYEFSFPESSEEEGKQIFWISITSKFARFTIYKSLMATAASRLIQDQNLNIHSAAPLGGKVDAPKGAKKGALGGRKALNDISNSGKPSALQASRQKNLTNVIPVAKDIGGLKHPQQVLGGKTKSRKALADLTNSVKPSVHHLSKKDQEKKLNFTAEKTIPSAKEEGFLHNHQECIKAQRKGINFEYFLETVGLGSPLVISQPLKLKRESPVKQHHLEMEEEIPLPLNVQDWGTQFPDCSSPVYGSPKSIKSAYELLWKDEENLADFKLIDSPKLQKH